MKNLLLFLGVTALLSSGCASIVSHTHWPVAISSTPVGATVRVTDRRGGEVFSGITPAALTLRSGNGFFRRAIYTLTFTKPGYNPQTVPLRATLNGWYFGNFGFGGVIGFLIVDPATGAMYRINQRQVQVALTETTSSIQGRPAPGSLRIMALSEVPAQYRAALVRIR